MKERIVLKDQHKIHWTAEFWPRDTNTDIRVKIQCQYQTL